MVPVLILAGEHQMKQPLNAIMNAGITSPWIGGSTRWMPMNINMDFCMIFCTWE